MSDTTKRGLRTLAQASFVAALIALAKAFGWVQWDETQTAAVMAVLTPVLTIAHNALEDTGMLPSTK